MRDMMLMRFGAVYLLELRLIVSHWGYWLLHLLWTVFMISSYADTSYGSSRIILINMTLGAVPIASLGAMMLAGVNASRATRINFDHLEATYPTGGEVSLGRWLATLSAMSAFLIVPISIALVEGTLADWSVAVPTFLLESITLFAFLTIGVWLVQVTIGIRRWLYFLFAVAWLGSVVIPSLLNVKIFPFALLLAYTTQGWLNEAYTEIWGRLTVGDLPLYHDLFYLALVIMLLGSLVLIVQRQRFYHVSRGIMILTTLGFVGVAVAGGHYSWIVVQANTQIERRVASLPPFSDVKLPADMPYAVVDYNLSLDLTNSFEPQFVTMLQVRNRGNEPLTKLDFTLNTQLAITDASVPYVRDNFVVSFMLTEPLLSSETVELTVMYSGKVWLYDQSLRIGRHREVANFVHPDGVNLSCTMAWYPIPGRIVVDRAGVIDMQNDVSRNYPDCLLNEPAPFTLTIDHPGRLTFVSNLTRLDNNNFASEGATWAHLMGSPHLRVETVREEITLVTAETLIDFATPLVATTYSSVLDDLQMVFPQINGVEVFVLDGGFGSYFSPIATPITDGKIIVVIPPYNLQALPDNPYDEYLYTFQSMIRSLFGVSARGFQRTYIDDISYFLWVYYIANGDPQVMGSVFEEGIPQGNVGTQTFSSQSLIEQHPLIPALFRVYTEISQDALIDLLARIYAESERLNTLSSDASRHEIEKWADEY